MNGRQVARAVATQMERAARRTRAIERGKVTGVDPDNGNTIVNYNGTELALPRTGPAPSDGSSIYITRTTAGLSISDRSAYGG